MRWGALIAFLATKPSGGHDPNDERRPFLPILCLVLGGLGSTAATSLAQFPGRGDDVTPSLGQFNVVVDPHYEDAVRSNPAYAPFLSNKGGHLNFTSPILFDPTTTIGRSDPLSCRFGS